MNEHGATSGRVRSRQRADEVSAMSHCGVIAIERADGWELYRSTNAGVDLHVGRQIADQIETGRPVTADITLVRSEATRSEVLDGIDWLRDEAAYLVSRTRMESKTTRSDPTTEITAYLTVPLCVEAGFPGAETASGAGALVAPSESDRSGALLRERLAAAREVCHALVSDGACTPSAARAVLEECCVSWGDTVIRVE